VATFPVLLSAIMHAMDPILKQIPTELQREIKKFCKDHEARVDRALKAKVLADDCRADTASWIDNKKAPAGLPSNAPSCQINRDLLLQPIDDSMTTLKAYVSTFRHFRNEDGSLKELIVKDVFDTLHSHYVSSMVKARAYASADAAAKAANDLRSDQLVDDISLLAAEINAKAMSVFGVDAPQPLSAGRVEELRAAIRDYHGGLVAKKAAAAWAQDKEAKRKTDMENKAKEIAASMPPERAMHTAVTQSTISTMRKAGIKIPADVEAKILRDAMSKDPPPIAAGQFGAGEATRDALARELRSSRRRSRSTSSRRPTSRTTSRSAALPRQSSKRRSESADSRQPKRQRSLSVGKGGTKGKGKGRGRGRGRGNGQGRRL
jgi:hypothetical protein